MRVAARAERIEAGLVPAPEERTRSHGQPSYVETLARHGARFAEESR
jgi:hypothetical protein